MADQRWQQFAEHRTGREVHDLLQYGHIIPVRRGVTTAYVEQHFPGWTWNELMDIWRAAGIVHPSRHGGPPGADSRVRMIHFSSPTAFAVEWADGDRDRAGRRPSACPRRPGTRRQAGPPTLVT